MPEYIDLSDFTENQIISVELLNDIINDIEFLREPPQGLYEIISSGADLTTTSTSFVDMTGFTRTVISSGGILEVSFNGRLDHSGSAGFVIDIVVDGVSLSGGNADGVYKNTRADLVQYANIRRFLNLPAGSHTIKLQWKLTSAGTGTLRAASNPQFYVREI